MTSTYLVIGASTGLGRATARALAREHRVVVAGRNPEADVRVDLRDLADVERAAGELRALGPFAGVVCNAGIQVSGEPRLTKDGFDETFAVNHLAHFAMVLHLLPALAAGARVAFIGSGTLDTEDAAVRRFGFRGGLYTDARSLAAGTGDPTVNVAQRARDRYATSKLCNVLTMRALARRVPAERLGVFAFDPGLMPGTGLAREYNVVLRVLWNTVMRLAALVMPGASSARRSGNALAWLMTTPDLAGVTGRYLEFHRRTLALPAVAQRDDWAEELYTASLALTGFARDPLAMPQNAAVSMTLDEVRGS